MLKLRLDKAASGGLDPDPGSVGLAWCLRGAGREEERQRLSPLAPMCYSPLGPPTAPLRTAQTISQDSPWSLEAEGYSWEAATDLAGPDGKCWESGQGSDQGSHLTSGLFITWALAVQACSRADYGSESLRDAPVSPKGMSREEGLLSSSGPSPQGLGLRLILQLNLTCLCKWESPHYGVFFLCRDLAVALERVFRVSRGHLTSSELKYPLFSLWIL